MKKKQKLFWRKFFSLVTGLALVAQSYLPLFNFRALAQELTPTPEPTPEITVTPETTPIVEPTPEPTLEPIIIVEPTPEITPEATPEATLIPTPTEEITPTPTTEIIEPTPTTSEPPKETGPPAENPTETPAVTPTGEILDGASTSAIEIEQQETGILSAVILENVAAPSLNLDNVDPNNSATLTTDKADYAPTDTVVITGSGFKPSENYTLIISSTDEPPVNFETQVTSDEQGNFIYAYQLDGNYRLNYKIEAKNSAGDIIAIVTFTDHATPKPDLTASKTNNVGGTVILPNSFNWTINVMNQGAATASFNDGEVIFRDNLPSSGATYGSVSYVPSGIVGTINCSITSNNLRCTASGTVSIPVSAYFDLTFLVTPDGSKGKLENPRSGSGMKCMVDPNNEIDESSGSNNDCIDDVNVRLSWPTSWITPNSCVNDPTGDESPDEIDLTGSLGTPAVGFFSDSNYQYFRERIDGSPGSASNLHEYAWVVLFQTSTPQYQFLGSLNGKDNKVQLYDNLIHNPDSSGILDFSPLLNDPADSILWEGPSSIYSRVTNAGSGVYYIDWAIPSIELTSRGISTSTTKYFATSANANNFNKDHLRCYEALSDLSVVKSDSPDPVTSGATLTYTLTIHNSGPDTASGVVVTDSLPDGYSVSSITPSQGSCSDQTEPDIQCELGSLANGANATITVVGTITTDLTSVTNSTTVSLDTTISTDTNQSNNNDSEDTTINPAAACGDGLINQTSEQCDDGAQNGIACTPNYADSCNYCSNSCQNVTVNGPYCGDNIQNGPEECDGTDGVPEYYSCTESCNLVQNQTDIAIEKTDSIDPVDNGGTLTYTLTVSNLSSDYAADNVVVTDTLPSGFSPFSVTPSQGTCSDMSIIDDPEIVCELDSIPALGSASVTIAGNVSTSDSSLTNNVIVTTSTPESDTQNNNDSEDTVVNHQGTLRIVKNTTGGDDTFGYSVYQMACIMPPPFPCIPMPIPVNYPSVTTTGGTGFTDINLTEGSYFVNESTIPDDWSLTSSQCSMDQGGVNVVVGQIATCTFENSRLPTLTVNKILSPVGHGAFDLKIDGTTYAFNVGDGGSTGAQTVSIGSHTFSEEAGNPSTVLSEYLVEYGGDEGCNNDGTVTLAAGENKTCTITNTAYGSITITKDLVPPDATLWDFTITGNGGPYDLNDLGDNQSQIIPSLVPGSYTISETTNPHYTTSIVCDDVTGTNGYVLNLVAGQNAQCLVTNTYVPYCGDGVVNQENEQCDGSDGVTADQNFCSTSCRLIPIYDGEHSCPTGYTASQTPVWSGTISSTDTNGQTFGLTSGGKYLFEATGTFIPTSAPGYLADAGYTLLNGTLSPQYGIQGTGNDYAAHALLANLGSGVGVVDWGTYNSSHVYAKYYEPTTSNVQFVIGDRYADWFTTPWQNQAGMNDNRGDLNLNVYECVNYGSISGKKFDDLYGNGVKNVDDPGIAGWTIELYDAPAHFNSSTTTDASGNYSFSNLLPGWYKVCEVPQTDWLRTMPTNSDCSSEFELHSSENIADLDFGNYDYSRIWGYKFSDDNNNEVWDDGENGLKGWTIYLDLNLNGSLDPDEPSTLTNSSGMYEFNDLTRGNYHGGYSIREILKPGWAQTYPKSGSQWAPTTSGSDERRDFGNLKLGSIQGKKFDDKNGNGTRQGGDTWLDGWTINLYDDSDGWVQIESMQTGDDATGAGPVEQGQYRFENLTPGNYLVCEEVKDGWTQTGLVGSGGRITSPNGDGTQCFEINLSSGDQLQGFQFGNLKLGRAQGMKYDDVDGDGLPHESGESFMDEWTIRLYQDWEELDEVVTSNTGTTGQYRFSDLVPGTYQVCEVMNPDWTQTWPKLGDLPIGDNGVEHSDYGQAVENESGAEDEGPICWQTVIDRSGDFNQLLRFGNTQFGTVTVNKDTDPISDPQYFDFTIQKDTTTVDSFSLQDADNPHQGDYVAGHYTITETENPAWAQGDISCRTSEGVTNLETHLGGTSFDLPAGGNVSCTFNNTEYGTVNVSKFNDRNENGSKDEGEENLPGWVITLTDQENQTTDSEGNVQFNSLLPGSYQLDEEINSGWTKTNISCDNERDGEITPSPTPFETNILGVDRVFALENGIDGHSVRVSAGEIVNCQIGNHYTTPILQIEKFNDATGGEIPGGAVIYTLTLKILGNPVYQTILRDLLPNGFVYRPGSWTATRNGNPFTVPEPVYASPGTWNLGDLAMGDEVILTLTADIDSGQKPGLYKDLAWAYGCQEDTDCPVDDALAILANAQDPGFLDDNFVGTQVDVDKETKSGASVNVTQNVTSEVLGASTELPATGAELKWLIFALSLGITGIGLIMVSRKLKKYVA